MNQIFTPVTKRTYSTLPISMPGYTILVVQEPSDAVMPRVMTQLPTDVVNEILRAVNSHDTLVTACRVALEEMKLAQHTFPRDADLISAIRLVRDALAAAGEEVKP